MIVYQLLKVQTAAGMVGAEIQKHLLLFPDFKSSWKANKMYYLL